jgi:DNA-directed RNA polymerase specialized sigma24 family protein
MNVPAAEPLFDPEHPLLKDRPRLESLIKKMLSRISSLMGVPSTNPGRGLSGAETAEDVLQQVLLELLQKPADYADNWEGLGMRIARLRAVDAVRRAVKGRQLPAADNDAGNPGPSPEIDVVSLDAEATQPSIEKMQRAGRLSTEMTPEEEYLEAERQEILWDLARDTLDEQDLLIYRSIHHHEMTPPAVARLPGVSVGERQVRNRIAEIERRLVAAAAIDPRFPKRSSGAADEHQGDVS